MIPTYRPCIGTEELEAVRRVFDSRWLGLGPVTKQFEYQLCQFLGARHVIAVSSGTAALHLALAALDIQPQDEVIIPSFTFVASVQAIRTAGAKPVFCEVCKDTLNMNIEDAMSRLTSRTRAIIPVHYAGSVCQMDELLQAVKGKSIRVVEDAAHAFGSSYKGRKVGTLGDITCFSFDPIKNITCGEGGAVATNDDEIAERIRIKRFLGINSDSREQPSNNYDGRHRVVTEGFRYHMSDLNAAIGLEQLKRLPSFKERKQTVVRRYDGAFAAINGLKLIKRNLDETFPFGYFIRVLNGRRNEMMTCLKEKDINTMVQSTPNHLQPAFDSLRVKLPVTEKLYDEIVTLPLYYEMTDSNVEKVITAVYSFFKKRPIGLRSVSKLATICKKDTKTTTAADIAKDNR